MDMTAIDERGATAAEVWLLGRLTHDVTQLGLLLDPGDDWVREGVVDPRGTTPTTRRAAFDRLLQDRLLRVGTYIEEPDGCPPPLGTPRLSACAWPDPADQRRLAGSDGGLEAFVALTEAGGRLWEGYAAADWARFCGETSWGELRSDGEPVGRALHSASRERLEHLFAVWASDVAHVAEGSEEWDEREDAPVLYWKRLPTVYTVRFRLENGRPAYREPDGESLAAQLTSWAQGLLEPVFLPAPRHLDA